MDFSKPRIRLNLEWYFDREGFPCSCVSDLARYPFLSTSWRKSFGWRLGDPAEPPDAVQALGPAGTLSSLLPQRSCPGGLLPSQHLRTLSYTFSYLVSERPSVREHRCCCKVDPVAWNTDSFFQEITSHKSNWTVVQLPSHVWIIVTSWTAACQASLSFIISQHLLKTYVHRVGDAIQPSHPLSPPSPLALNLSQHQGVFQWVQSSHHQVAKVLALQHQSFQWTVAHQALLSVDFPDKDNGVGGHSLLLGIFLTQNGAQFSFIAGKFFIVWATNWIIGKT